MPVGFRSFLNVDPGQNLIDTVVERIDAWSAGKGIGTHAGIPGNHAVGEDKVDAVVREDDGNRQVYRWRRQRRPDAVRREMWRTTVTAVEPLDSPGWLWVEIESQLRTADHGTFMSVPSVLRGILADLSCHDGRSGILAAPREVSVDELPDVMDCLADETRRGPIYVVSGQVPHAGDLGIWAAEVMWDVVGLGSVYVLGDEAEREFNEMVGIRHAVPTGTMRTYLPGVNLDDPNDPQRHQILGRTRIEWTEPRRLARILGLAQRERSAQAELPVDAVELDQLLTGDAEPVPQAGRTNLRAIGTDVRIPAGRSSGPLVHVVTAGSPPTESAGWRLQPRRLPDLVTENQQLRHEIEKLTSELRSYQHRDGAVETVLETLEMAIKALQGHSDLDNVSGHQRQLSAS